MLGIRLIPNLFLSYLQVGSQLRFVAQLQVELQLREKFLGIHPKPTLLFLSQLQVRSQLTFIIELQVELQLGRNAPESVLILYVFLSLLQVGSPLIFVA
jgi:hypothetical protein